MEETPKQNNKEHSATNWWKWAFLSLVSLIVIALIYFLSILQPVSIKEETTEPVQLEKEMSLVSSFTKEDVETLMNTYLETLIEDEEQSYEIKLDDQLEIQSSVEILKLNIPYTLSFNPYVTEDGDLQLRADSIDLANFSMPVGAVLSIVSHELDLPFYIDIDSEDKMILVNFNELSAHYDIGMRMEKIDLENNDIQLKLSLNKDTLIEALDFEKKSQLMEDE